MSDFYPLNEPHLDSYLGMWFVCAERRSDGTPQILNIYGNVVELNQKTVCTYFNEEHAAHKAAYMYYMNHYNPYPYTAKWIESTNMEPIVTATQTIGSQVMRFG